MCKIIFTFACDFRSCWRPGPAPCRTG